MIEYELGLVYYCHSPGRGTFDVNSLFVKGRRDISISIWAGTGIGIVPLGITRFANINLGGII